MSEFDKLSPYKSFLLTVWAEPNADHHPRNLWRFSLQDPHTGRRRGFASLEALMTALRQITADLEAEGDDSC